MCFIENLITKALKLLVVFVFLNINSLGFAQEIRSFEVSDPSRNRKIPIVIYQNTKATKQPTIIISHGYGIKNTEYSFIANSLASLGYNLISIQHDLPTDPQLPRDGNLFERRKSHWEKGVQNVLFIINALKKEEKHLNLNTIILIGHSNGGDISMMFAYKNPKVVSKVISLDSLRYPFPVNIPVLHFGASDTIADKRVVLRAVVK